MQITEKDLNINASKKDNNKIKIVVNSKDCISCWACIAISDEKLFVFDENSKSVVKKQPETDNEILIVKDCIESCPVQVIHSEEK